MPSHVCNAIIQNRFKFCNTLISLFGILLVKFLPFFLCSLLIYAALHFWDPKFFLKIYIFRVITANFCHFWNLQLIFKMQYSRIVFRFFWNRVYHVCYYFSGKMRRLRCVRRHLSQPGHPAARRRRAGRQRPLHRMSALRMQMLHACHPPAGRRPRLRRQRKVIPP